MRRFVPLINIAVAIVLLTASWPAVASPSVVGRVGLVATGQLAADSLAAGAPDGRALITVRVPGGAAAFDAPVSTRARSPATSHELRATADDLRRLLALPDVLTIEERRILRPLLDASGRRHRRSRRPRRNRSRRLGHARRRHRHRRRLPPRGSAQRGRHDAPRRHPRLRTPARRAASRAARLQRRRHLVAARHRRDARRPPARRPPTPSPNRTLTATARMSPASPRRTGCATGQRPARGPLRRRRARRRHHCGSRHPRRRHIHRLRRHRRLPLRSRTSAAARPARRRQPEPRQQQRPARRLERPGARARCSCFPPTSRARAWWSPPATKAGATSTLAPGRSTASVTASVDTASSSQPDAQLAFELWHTGSFQITVVSPAGHRYGPAKPGLVYQGPNDRRRPGAHRQRRDQRPTPRRPAGGERRRPGPAGAVPASGTLGAAARRRSSALGYLDQRRACQPDARSLRRPRGRRRPARHARDGAQRDHRRLVRHDATRGRQSTACPPRARRSSARRRASRRPGRPPTIASHRT